jgi:iron complex transport system substrate-binding protein
MKKEQQTIRQQHIIRQPPGSFPSSISASIRIHPRPNLFLSLCLCVSVAILVFGSACARFRNAPTDSKDARYVVISPIYNEIIWALGVQEKVVGVDLSTTYPPDVKNKQTVGYHRALSAEGILSLHPTTVIHDNNIGPPQVVQQLQQLNIPMKTFTARNDSFDGAKALIREMGAYFHKEARAEELCNTMDAQRAASLEKVKQYTDHPRVAVIHFGRASNVYMVVGKGGGGDGGGVSQMIELAGGEMAGDNTGRGMQRMESPEILAKANPDIILMTDYGYDRLNGSLDQIKALPGVATSNAAKTGRIYRIEENVLNYFGPRSGENIGKVAAIIHQK